MIIFDRTNPPAPFFTRRPPPEHFKTALDEIKYWKREMKYWTEGYNEDINGMLYFYATQIMLKNRITGELYYPTVRDVDVLIFNELWDCWKKGESPFIIKGRGVGLSSIGMNLPFYFFRTMPNTKCIATSRDKKTLATLFTDKSMIGYNYLNEKIKFDQINLNQTSSESFLRLGMKYINKEGKEDYAESEFLCRDTQESDAAANNFSGAGAIFGFADEAPLMKRFGLFFDSAREVFFDHATNKMVGLLFSGGTVEASIKPEDIQRIQAVWESAKKLRIRPIFIPATWGKNMINGHSDHELTREQILARRAELETLEDKSRLKGYIKNNPLVIEDIFEFASSNRWEEYTRECINLRVKQLLADPPPVSGWDIIDEKIADSDSHKLTAVPNNKSLIKILEHPKKGVKYVWAVDSMTSVEETSGESGNSKFAITVFKGVDPQADYQFCPVAHYKERPSDFDAVFDKGIRLLRYYNQFRDAKCTGELNSTGGVYCQKIQKQSDLKKTVMARRDLSKKGWVDTNKPWFTRTDDIKDWQYKAANTYIKKYHSMIFFLDILEDCQKAEAVNKDSLDSFLAGLYGFGTGDLLEETQVNTNEYTMDVMCGWDENGKPIWITKTYYK